MAVDTAGERSSTLPDDRLKAPCPHYDRPQQMPPTVRETGRRPRRPYGYNDKSSEAPFQIYPPPSTTTGPDRLTGEPPILGALSTSLRTRPHRAQVPCTCQASWPNIYRNYRRCHRNACRRRSPDRTRLGRPWYRQPVLSHQSRARSRLGPSVDAGSPYLHHPPTHFATHRSRVRRRASHHPHCLDRPGASSEKWRKRWDLRCSTKQTVSRNWSRSACCHLSGSRHDCAAHCFWGRVGRSHLGSNRW